MKSKKKESLQVNITKSVIRELSPNLTALVLFLLIAQIIFFTLGKGLILQNTPREGLILMNFLFAVLVPYSLAMVVKAIILIEKTYPQK